MKFRHTIHVFIDNFAVTYKQLLYRLVIALIAIGLYAAILTPFVKWAGGKSQLTNELEKMLFTDTGRVFTKYCEPMIGGGALFFDVLTKYDFKELYIGDINSELINSYKVIKNNITRRALQECGIEGLEAQLEGPTAVILGNEDYLEPAKAIYEYSKKNENCKIKGGIIEGKVMTAEEIITLAKLPSRQTLLGMLAGALLGNVTKLAVALDQVKVQKEANA